MHGEPSPQPGGIRHGTPFTRLRRFVSRRVSDPAGRLVALGEALDRLREALRDGKSVLSALDRGFRDGLRSVEITARWRRGAEPRLVEVAEGYLDPEEARLAADIAIRRVLSRPDRYRGECFQDYLLGHLRLAIRDIVSRGPAHAAASVHD